MAVWRPQRKRRWSADLPSAQARKCEAPGAAQNNNTDKVVALAAVIAVVVAVIVVVLIIAVLQVVVIAYTCLYAGH